MNRDLKPDWFPFASLECMKLRAVLFRAIREYFYQRDILEVETPILSAATVTDPFIESFQSQYQPLFQQLQQTQFYLQTSPEYAMKRLLAAGSGSIYQISKVFRQGEIGQRHNPEFTLLEWYRVGWDHHLLMQEVSHLVEHLLSPYLNLSQAIFISYESLFQEYFSINPHIATKQQLLDCIKQAGLGNVLEERETTDRFLELLFSHCIEPKLGQQDDGQACVCCVYHYPANQASLAKISEDGQYPVAQRFEVFVNGMELGNGFNELNNAQEQHQRFENDNEARNKCNQQSMPIDELFLQAVEQLPDCAGVAIGLDRLLMLICDSKDIKHVLNFPFDKA